MRAPRALQKSLCIQIANGLPSSGIRVNCISLGYVNTEMNAEIVRQRPEVLYYLNEAPPMKRFGQHMDLAGGLVWLMPALQHV
ncbi:uncharacterized protein A1O5_11536 [Cladophialophora psammophila CBS 110553]|uniref:3-oxoacyl-[acyl-carrier protein] reductase n=1 Tax=Cladophialophora psammophila CBS 110553 TaxID=1182543 RepID=W9W5V6_9EURO|nr:uncharacterized protein A1O5_11536 [Cladophialophora psammophila CBS 110553]EXJ63487.1 hypothetical protein A1O5_11536 [Cladophialophora psammophila CBS 110553]